MDLRFVEEFAKTVLSARETNGRGVGTNDEIRPEGVCVEAVPGVEQQNFAVVVGERRQCGSDAVVSDDVLFGRRIIARGGEPGFENRAAILRTPGIS